MRVLAIVIVLVVLIWGLSSVGCEEKDGHASIRVFCYPSAQVNTEGLTFEAPTSGALRLTSGRRHFLFTARHGGYAMDVDVRLRKDRHYVLNVDLEKGTYDLDGR
jgi:hypothetical protein